MPGLDPIQVTVGGSAACLGVYAVLTALVVYNSKKCAYCDQRLVVCNYLIALCSCEPRCPRHLHRHSRQSA
jgi:secreted trypsin-like serine protease